MHTESARALSDQRGGITEAFGGVLAVQKRVS